MAFHLLKCLARAIAKHGVKFVCQIVPGSEALYDIAADAYKDYRQHGQEDALRAEVQALAQAPAEQVRQEVREAVAAEAAELPAAVRQKIAVYLSQVPAVIRRSLRRPSDPTGTTVPPSLALNRPDDLLVFLPPRPSRFQVGDRPLPGVDWILEEPLGIGGFGEVWKARHAHLKSIPAVALKFCLDPTAVPVLRNEAGVLDRVMQHGRHPGIVPLLQTYLSADPPCLEYEYVEGGELTSLIQEAHGRGQMTPALACRMMGRLAEIVAFAHQSEPPIVHGDLKPANVLVRRGANGGVELRVTDFGIGGLAAARAARETRQPTQSRQVLLTEAVRGAYTPLYASPEQMRRRPGEPADPRDDVHALGVMWYQLLTGDVGMLNVPTDWREQVEKRGLGQGLIKLLAACIAPQAASRPANASAIAEALKRELQTESVLVSTLVAPSPQPAPRAHPLRSDSGHEVVAVAPPPRPAPPVQPPEFAAPAGSLPLFPAGSPEEQAFLASWIRYRPEIFKRLYLWFLAAVGLAAPLSVTAAVFFYLAGQQTSGIPYENRSARPYKVIDWNLPLEERQLEERQLREQQQAWDKREGERAAERQTLFDAAYRRARNQELLGILVVILAGLALLAAGVLFCMLLYKAWNQIQDGHARTNAGKAVGLLFIPLFVCYWVFVAVYGLAWDLHNYIIRRRLYGHHNLTPLPVSPGLSMVCSILLVCFWVPVLDFFTILPMLVVLAIWLNAVKNASMGIAAARLAEPTSDRPW